MEPFVLSAYQAVTAWLFILGQEQNL